MLLVAAQLKPFQGQLESSRLRVVCWTPYFTDGILAGLGGLLNPLGLFFVIASALPSTLGANAGLLSLPGLMNNLPGLSQRRLSEQEQVGPVSPSAAWITTGAVCSLLFIVVLGRGITWSR
jgi:hypothetical protein